MRLSLGSGPHYAEGWVNIDAYAEADVTADVLALPFADGAFAQVYAGHVLEHIPFDLLPAMLAEVRRVLRPGGVFAVVGPCIELALQTGQPRWLLDDIVKGTGPSSPGAAHQWTATGLLTLLAVQSVFADAKLVPVAEVDKPEWPNPVIDGWQCAVLAAA